jgi:hypothetical protein
MELREAVMAVFRKRIVGIVVRADGSFHEIHPPFRFYECPGSPNGDQKSCKGMQNRDACKTL